MAAAHLARSAGAAALGKLHAGSTALFVCDIQVRAVPGARRGAAGGVPCKAAARFALAGARLHQVAAEAGRSGP